MEITLTGQLRSHVCCIGRKGSWGPSGACRLEEEVLSHKLGPTLQHRSHNTVMSSEREQVTWGHFPGPRTWDDI